MLFTVNNSLAENTDGELNSFSVMQQETVFEMSASRLARTKKTVKLDVIRLSIRNRSFWH